jgi:hypothetical protein
MIASALIVAASLVVGANEIAGGVAEPGWPIVISALFTPDSSSAVVPTKLTVRLIDARGNPVPLAFEATAPRRGASGWVRWIWHASEAATRGLAPGLYKATLEASPPDSTLWVSPGTLRVVAIGKGRPQARGQLVIERALLMGRADDALGEANRLVAKIPEDEAAWVARGDLYLAKDMPDSASASYDRALAVHKSGEGLELFRRKRAAFFKLLEKRGGRRDSTDNR